MLKKRFGTLGAALLVSTFLFAGCGTPSAGTAHQAGVQGSASGTNEAVASPAAVSSSAKAGGTLKIAIQNDADGLDPHRTVSASTFEVTNNIYDTLVGTSPKGKLMPRLAVKWSASQDGKTWTFDLRSGVKFSNGAAFSADDVKYSLDRIMAKGSPRASDYKVIDSIQVDSPTRLTITLKQADAPFLSSLAMPWAAIVPKGASDSLKTEPVGTGPFMLKQWTPQQKIVLVKNPYYYEAGKPYLDSVEFDIIPDTATQMMDLESGSIDVASISGEQAAQVKSSSNLALYEKPSNSVQIMAMNNKVKPLNDIRVRQAIDMAIHKQAVIAGSDWGYGQVIGSHLSPVDPYYVDTTGVLPYNIQKAKKLLQEAGYGKGFDITLALPQPYSMHIKAGQVIADQLKKIGINVKLQTVDWGKWVKDIYLGRHYDMTIISHTGRLDPDAMLNRYASDSNENYMNYDNAKVDQWLKQGRETTDSAQRHKLYADIERQLANDVPAVYLQAPDTLFAMNKNVHGFETYPIDIFDFTHVYLAKN